LEHFLWVSKQRRSTAGLATPRDPVFVKKVIGSMPGSMVIGVDRLDYSKGLPHRLEAFEKFLGGQSGLAWTGELSSDYAEEPFGKSRNMPISGVLSMPAAGRINATYGDPSWIPVRYINRTYGRTALAGLYRSARVGLVTSLRDGMNLVSKEYVAAQDGDDPGVLVLSRFAGASAELRAALLVNPYDPEAVGAAVARALEMSRDERIARHAELLCNPSAKRYRQLGRTLPAGFGGRSAGA
jgi:trehalose 6-phosphate synthase